MKSFTKFYVLLLAMLMSSGIVFAQFQDMTPDEYKMYKLEQQKKIAEKGPETPVLNYMGGRATGDNCNDPYTYGNVNDAAQSAALAGGEEWWYEINVQEDLNVTFSLCGSDFDTKLDVWDDCTAQTWYNDDACGLQSEIAGKFYPGGTTVYVKVYGYSSSSAGNYTLTVTGTPPPPPSTAIATFPYMGDFESCTWPAEMTPVAGAEAHAVVSSQAGFESSCGALLDGNSYAGFYHEYNGNCDNAFNNNDPLHMAKIQMTVEPTGGAGALQLDFDFQQFYSFADYYSWFRVTVNGTTVMEKNSGETCLQTSTATGSGWSKLIYDLSAYQTDASFDIEIQYVGKYYYLYYQGGDAVMIDNVQVWYVPAGDVEGYAYNMGVAEDGVEIGFIGDDAPYAPVMSDAVGYYRFSNVQTEPTSLWPMYAFKDGLNYIEAEVQFIAFQTIQHDWNISSPLMVITPAVLEETMNPNEWRSVPITITNGPTGGPLHWTTEIMFGEPPSASSSFVKNDITDPSVSRYGDVSGTEIDFIEFETDDSFRDEYCPEESVFSNNMVGANNAYTMSGAYTCYQQFVDASGPFGGLTFYVLYTSAPAQPQTFTIEVYEDGGSTPGALVASYAATIEGVVTATTVIGYPTYQFTFDFEESFDMESGWIGIQAGYNPSYWAHTFDPAATGLSLQNTVVLPQKLAMCLSGASGGGWLDLSAYEGDVAPGESDFVSALFDATGTVQGQVWTADIAFTAQPNISTATVDVSMIIAGEPLVPIEDFEAELVNMVTGQVDMSWTYSGNDITFEYFLVRRDGSPVANTQNSSYTDFLPDYGEFCYSVSAVFTEGESVPAGPECVVWLIPELCYTPDPVVGYVWTGYDEVVQVYLENCGEGMLSFEFTGFDDPDFSNGFVTGADPYMGVIEEGDGMYVNLTFDATGYSAGTYFTDLELMTNELAPDNERMIACEMFAYTPAMFVGTVTDCDNGLPLSNVTVRASSIFGDFFGETDATGYYEVVVDAAFDPWGAYFLEFEKLSFDTKYLFGLNIAEGEVQTNDVTLCETPYPVQWVNLDPNEADTQALITWSLPMGPYEIIYDDGSADNYFAWIQWGGATAVKFTPAGYPASVIGGRIFVGDGSYPEGANFIGAPMVVGVLDDDGPNGMPGTVLDSLTITCTNYGWQEFALSGTTFTDGNFYLVYWQITVPPFSPPVGVDEENPVVFRSYTKQAGMEWGMSSYNDFMMRATVMGPGDNVMANMMEGESVIPPKPTDGAHIAMKLPTGASGTVKGGEFKAVATEQSSDRDLEKYRIAYVDGFDPEMGEMPWDGNLTPFGTTTNTYRTHAGWGGFAPGFYAYAVRAEYESSESIWVYSNVAAHLLDREVTVNVVQCDGEEPSGALVTMMGHNYPYQMLSMVTPASGTVVFDSVIMGVYDLAVNKLGYQSWEWPNMVVSGDMVVDVTLQETEYPARNLYVDPLTSVATWDEPLYIQLPLEGFEGDAFPPAGWQSVTTGIGWQSGSDGSSSFWTIPAPPEESGDKYAYSNDDQNSGNQQNDYLITPEMDLREASDYVLNSLWYYDGGYGHPAPAVLYTTDGGATWEVLAEVSANFSWQEVNVDLADISGPDGLSSVWFALWQEDGGIWGSGCAADNIYVGNGPVEVMGYHVFLDDGFVAETDADTRTYTYRDLQYGTVYTAGVAALYACNVSDLIYYTFTSGYLYPPRNLYDEYLYNTNEVPLFWNPPVTGSGVPMAASNGEYTEGIYELSAGRAPLNGVAVSEQEDADPIFLNGFRAPTVYGVSNDIPAYAWFDAEAPGTVTQIAAWPSGNFANAAEIVTGSGGEEMYEVDNTGSTRHVNLVDGTVTDMGNIGVLANAMGLDYTTGVYYATDGDNLYTLDFDAMTSELVGSLGSGAGNLMIGMTFDTDGNLWMYDIAVDMMWSCDKETGACTSIGNIGYDANFGQGMAWDQANEVAVLSAFNGGTFACEYRVADLTTGNTTFVGNIGSPGGTQFGTIAIPVVSGPGGGGDVPDGLMSFNVYQDDMLVGNKIYEGQGTEELVSWVHNPVDPGCYDYTVTAVYDLSVYGFPGETGESYHEGPDTVCVVWGYDLPFMEDWTEGNLDFNQWRTQSGVNNWMVSSQNGNPAPAAQFNWDPAPGAEYSVTLESAPLKADLMTEGDIWMDFEYFLEDRNATGEEKLVIEVFNGQEWMQVAEYANTASMDWTFQHLKITEGAMGRVFQVRFNAMGMNSFDIVRWDVDNIYIYRTCSAPSDLAGTYDGDGAANDGADFGSFLTWEAPEIPVPPQGWIRWDSGSIFSGVGLTDGGDFTVATRWDAGQLAEYAGTSLTKVQIGPNDDGFTNVTIKIWTGANASTLVYESGNLNPTPLTWNEYTIDPPIALDIDDELWVGYSIVGQPAGSFPAGTDAGPAITGYGDKITTDGVTWDNLSELGLDYNWSIAAYVETLDGTTASLPSLVDDMDYNNTTTSLVRGDLLEEGVAFSSEESSRDFAGFAVYRMGPDDTEYMYLDDVAYVEGQLSYEYYDADPYPGVYPYEVCYQVTAMWESETDVCESAPAASVIPIWDYVCVIITGVDNPLAGEMTALYPNPATDRVNISSSQSMSRVTVFNYVGQVVYDSEMHGEQSFILNTSSYDAGVYVVKIGTDNGVVTKRMTITK